MRSLQMLLLWFDKEALGNELRGYIGAIEYGLCQLKVWGWGGGGGGGGGRGTEGGGGEGSNSELHYLVRLDMNSYKRGGGGRCRIFNYLPFLPHPHHTFKWNGPNLAPPRGWNGACLWRGLPEEHSTSVPVQGRHKVPFVLVRDASVTTRPQGPLSKSVN